MKFLTFLSSKKDNDVVKEHSKSTNEIIEEIHVSFYTEVERLLEYANVKAPETTTMQDKLNKAKRLKELGFTQSKTTSEALSEESRLAKLRKENQKKEGLKEAIIYFSQKYPQYKFITEASVRKICEKYGLVYGSVKNFTGDVPDENLQHIENFKIKEEDKCFYRDNRYNILDYDLTNGDLQSVMRKYGSIEYMSYGDYKEIISHNKKIQNEIDSFCYSTEIDKHNLRGLKNKKYAIGALCPLEIAAPLSDFNARNMNIENNKLIDKIPDPVVLQPVYYKNEKHYLVVTAWGLEAEDELVINEKMN